MIQVDEATKGTVLSAFYWGYGISQVGTLLPERHHAQPEDAVHLCSRQDLLDTNRPVGAGCAGWPVYLWCASVTWLSASLPKLFLAAELRIWEADFTQQPWPWCAHAQLSATALLLPRQPISSMLMRPLPSVQLQICNCCAGCRCLAPVQPPSADDTHCPAPRLVSMTACCRLQIPGGSAAQRYGGRLMLMVSFALWSTASLLTPGSARNTAAIACARVLVGVAQGFLIPSVHTVLSQVSD